MSWRQRLVRSTLVAIATRRNRTIDVSATFFEFARARLQAGVAVICLTSAGPRRGFCLRCALIAAAFMSTIHPDYSTLAARIAVSNLHKNSLDKFSDVCASMASYVHPKTMTPSPLLAEDINAFVQENKEVLDAAIVHDRDFQYVPEKRKPSPRSF